MNRLRVYVSLKTPSARDLKSFVSWMTDNKPLTAEESAFTNNRDDFVALSSGQECGWLDGKIEDMLTFCLPERLIKVRYPFS